MLINILKSVASTAISAAGILVIGNGLIEGKYELTSGDRKVVAIITGISVVVDIVTGFKKS